MQSAYNEVLNGDNIPFAISQSFVDGSSGTNFSLANIGCYFADCPMGRLVTQSLMNWCYDCDITFYNAGSFRSDIKVGNVSKHMLVNALPFGDNIVSFSLLGIDIATTCNVFYTGSTLISAMNHMVSLGTGWSGFLHFCGLRYAWNPHAELYSRLLEVQIFDKNQNEYVALDVNRVYKVATNAYLR